MDRISRTFAVWDAFVAECAREGLTVDPHAMTVVLLRTLAKPRRAWPTRWEWVVPTTWGPDVWMLIARMDPDCGGVTFGTGWPNSAGATS